MNEKKQYDNNIYYIKALAVFSVICAHVSPVNETSGTLNVLAGSLLGYLGTMGVPVFFLLTGYLFEGSRGRYSFIKFWQKKAITIIVPWLVCVTALWLFITVRKGGWSFKAYLLYLVGYASPIYFLSVTCMLFLILWFVKSDMGLSFIMILWLASFFSTALKADPLNRLNNLFGTAYLNPFNWIGFAAAGMFINKHGLGEKIVNKIVRFRTLWVLLSVIYFSTLIHWGKEISYFGTYSLPGHVINILLLTGLGVSIGKSRISPVLEYAGRYSFSIYLLHLFIAGAIVRLGNLTDLFVFTLLRPFLAMAVVLGVIWLIRYISRGRPGFIKTITGMRD